jgi:diguanylate cyclase
VKRDKAKLLKCLTQILQSTEQLNADVDSHNDKLATVRQSVHDIRLDSDLNVVQNQLFEEIHSIVNSNRRLENDLTISQYQLRQRAEELDSTRSEARLDKLSGIANRRAFDEGIEFFYSRYESRQERFGFCWRHRSLQRVNDAYGHAAGDHVIQRIGAILKQSVRGDDLVARIGGDEFAILLKGSGNTDFPLLAARIRSIVAQSNFAIGDEKSQTSVTVSVGVAVVQAGDTKDSLMDRADKALYRSKELGRNLVHAWDRDNSLINISALSDAT